MVIRSPRDLYTDALHPTKPIKTQLALLTVFMGMGGSLARMFTTLKELGANDPQMRIYGLAALLNVVLFVQVRVWVGKGWMDGCFDLMDGPRTTTTISKYSYDTHQFTHVRIPLTTQMQQNR